MKEFRIARCLDISGIKEYAIFADGSRKKLIKNDSQYGKYFEVDNELNSEKGFNRFSFLGRIKDAVDMVKDGNGDCIKSYNLIGGRIDKVLYFIDRHVGEELRQKTIEGWYNTKFGWGIECGCKNSLSGYSMLNEKTERISMFTCTCKPISFESEADAAKHIEKIIDKSKYYAKCLAHNLSGITDSQERDKTVGKLMDEIEEYSGTKFSIIHDFVFDMLTDDLQLKTPDCNLDEMGYKIIQCVINTN